MSDMTPKMIVAELNRFVVGQDAAKRAVAVALRNRWRRQQLPADLRDEGKTSGTWDLEDTGIVVKKM